MAIERDVEGIKFHELGTLTSVTRWISTHDEGIAEWLKNARRAYQPDKADVEEAHRAAVLLLKDADGDEPARIGLLDVGGATLEDVTRWSTWQDPEASRGLTGLRDEDTQGNGGKAYMYRLFSGPASILGVVNGKRNCKGFEGPANTLERGTPGFVPDLTSGRDLQISSWESELNVTLVPYKLSFRELPKEVGNAIRMRQAFTIVEGVDPYYFYKGRIDAEDLLSKVLRHDQSTLAVQQLRVYAFHNGLPMNAGKPLGLEPIVPYPGFEQPTVHEIPEELPGGDGQMQSTTLGGQRAKGRVVLYTSRENMPNAYKKLKPRWRVTYRTQSQMIGSKAVSELVPGTPGSYFVYATVELSALEPDYVELGRRRPNPGPLVEAVDLFVAEKLRTLAKEINDLRRHEFDKQALDEVHDENRKLNNFKNRFLPSGGPSGDGGPGKNGRGPKPRPPHPRGPEGEIPDCVELDWDTAETLRIGKGVNVHAGPILQPRILDALGRVVRHAELEWCSADSRVLKFVDQGVIWATGKGRTEIWARVKRTNIESPRVQAEVWAVDHVLLTPRTLDIPLGKKKQIVAEVTSDEGSRATKVFLNWSHDADDPLIVRIHPTGWITGNRLGKTTITAGAGEPSKGGVWARIGAEVEVVPNPEEQERGGGFPELLLTGKDIDPATGEVRQGNPDQPALWQEVTDYQHNIWWLNLESPEAAFFFGQREEDIKLWRSFHAQKVVDMVIQVHMREEFDARGDAERPDLWNRHKQTLESFEVLYTQAMWDKLNAYVRDGEGLE